MKFRAYEKFGCGKTLTRLAALGSLSGGGQGCPGKLCLQERQVVAFHITPNSSCADVIRASTPWFRTLEGVGGRDKPGQDEL